MSNSQFNYLTYGTKTNSLEIEKLLNHIFQNSFQHNSNPTPICIWGMHGIGKTELVKQVALNNDFEFTYIAPAQFEEMGDLIGMPKIELNDEENAVTKFIPPSWVPNKNGPGIFLIDDINRADDRILRGMMQLMQNYELVSWKMPSKWLFVLTANPDGGDYSVTTMDDAMLSRMLHVTMEFDVKSWARWAEKTKVDSRGISFVLTYPELVNGKRTTPRSLVQFFETLNGIDNLKEKLDLVKILGDGCLESETTVAFINFVHMDLDRLINPEEILNSNHFLTIKNRLKDLVEGKTKRLDILSVILTRLTNHLIYHKTSLEDKAFENLKKFILLELIPNDLRLAMAQDLVMSSNKGLVKLYSVPAIGKLLLQKM
ncbi:AAA family ATPase [uncultured Arcticibacterium sp.]|uniref:AAA family ATPase n=1 Tax=uncultured Arcticibacterium sp. TaxID=2173042 RepID=UPI0030FCED45